MSDPQPEYPKWICPVCKQEPKRGTWNGLTLCCHAFPVLCISPRHEQQMRQVAQQVKVEA